MTQSPYIALRYPDFRRLISNTFLLTAATLIQEVVIGYELYKLTHDPLTLGFIGLAEAIPYISLALFGGHYADRGNRKRLMQISLLVITISSLVIVWLTHPDTRGQLPQRTILLGIYFLLATIGFAKGFYSPAASSLRAFVTPKEHYGNAATWSSTFWQMGAILGPALGGFLYAFIGLTNTLLLVVGLILVCFTLISTVKINPPAESEKQQDNIWQSIREGFDFVFKNKIILYSISLDLVAVLFGGVVAILPIFAEDILKVGPEGLGVLRAAPSVGAVITIFATAYFPPINQAWKNMMIAVAGFGLATLVFALSTNFWLSVAMLFLTGAFDSISVVIRQTILQAIPPDHIRGRVQSVNSIFVSASNELGAFESGVAAKLLGTTPSVLAGAGLTLVIVTYIYFTSKELFDLKL